MSNSFTDFSDKNYWLALAIAGVLFVAAIEVILRVRIATITNNTAHLVHLVYSGKAADVVIGDSHLYRAFIADDRFLHLTRGGLSPKAMRIVGEHYFANRQPNRVIIGIGPQLLARESTVTRFSEYFEQYRWFGYGLYALEPGIHQHTAWLYQPSRITRERRRTRDDRHSQGQWHRIDSASQRRRMQTGLEEQRPKWPHVATSGIGHLQALVAQLSAKGADVCLLRAPVVDAYRAHMDKHADYRRAERAWRALATDSGARYVDYIDLDLSLQDSDFLNQDHLAASASKRFVASAVRACFDR